MNFISFPTLLTLVACAATADAGPIAYGLCQTGERVTCMCARKFNQLTFVLR